MADTIQVVNNAKIYFKGQKMAFETITSLIGSKENQTVIFGGTSAGGRGSMVTIDNLAPFLPKSTKLFGLHDSADYIQIQPMDSDFTSFDQQCKEAFGFFNQPQISEKCRLSYPTNEHWKCLCGEFMLPLVQTPSQIVIFQYDSFQLDNNLGNPSRWTEEHCEYAETQFQPKLMESIEQLAKKTNHSLFAPSCHQHGINLGEAFETLVVGDMTANEQLVKLVQHSEINVAISSEKCDPTCSKCLPCNGTIVNANLVLTLFMIVIKVKHF